MPTLVTDSDRANFPPFDVYPVIVIYNERKRARACKLDSVDGPILATYILAISMRDLVLARPLDTAGMNEYPWHSMLHGTILILRNRKREMWKEGARENHRKLRSPALEECESRFIRVISTTTSNNELEDANEHDIVTAFVSYRRCIIII